MEPNGVITKYRVRSAQYEGSQPNDDLQVSWQEVGPGVFRKLLENQTPERNYVVEIQAETSKGWGEQVRKTTRTVKYARKYFLNTLGNIALTYTVASVRSSPLGARINGCTCRLSFYEFLDNTESS